MELSTSQTADWGITVHIFVASKSEKCVPIFISNAKTKKWKIRLVKGCFVRYFFNLLIF